MSYKCPGTDSRNLKIDTITCPACGYQVEVFSDELRNICPRCKATVMREKIPSCIDWCGSARECLGEAMWEEVQKDRAVHPQRTDLKEKLMLQMRLVYGTDGKRIYHAEKVTRYAEQLLEKEGGDRNVVLAAAILHDIGIPACEKKYGSAGGQLQEKEGPPVARKIMDKLGIKPEVIDEVCAIIGSHHSPGEVNTKNFHIIWDSDWLVNLRHLYGPADKEKLKKRIEKVFKTKTGKEIAELVYLATP
jgi:hypothetical protein